MKKHQNYQNLSTNSLFTMWANNVMTFHKVKKEWKTAIIFSTVIKAITMVFSVFAAYQYIFDLLFETLNNYYQSVIFTIIALLSLEFLTAIFLEKTFKFTYRKRFKTALPSFFVVLALFSISFVSSTNGLAKRQSEKKDKTSEITKLAAMERDSILQIYRIEKAEYQNQIKTIKSNPQGWQNGKRCILRTWQLNEIKAIQQKIESLKSNLQDDLSVITEQSKSKITVNKAQQNKFADKYYKIMTVIMIIQLFSTALLIFFLHLIRVEEQPDAVIQENLDYIQESIEQSAQTVMHNSIVTAMNKFNDMSLNVFAAFEQPDTLKDVTKIQQNATRKSIGFSQEKKEDSDTEKNNFFSTKETATSSRYLNTPVDLKTVDIEYLNKHKKLVLEIIKLSPLPKHKITNSQVQTVQQKTPKNIQKSRSTIHKVFVAMQGVGIDNFDKNGNIKH